MTIWEKAILNMQRGSQKLSAAAAVFSERVKAEIAIARLRIRLDEEHARIDEQHRIIGRKIVDLHRRSELPKASEQLLKDDDIDAALTELATHEKECENLLAEIVNEQAVFKTAAQSKEETAIP